MKRILGENAPLPQLDPLNYDYFTHGAVMIQRCKDCLTFQHPPEEVCNQCQSFNLEAHECAGTGRIESKTTVHKSVHPGLMNAIPYAVAVISLDDAKNVNVIGNIRDCAPADVEIGQRVKAVFEEVPAGKNNEAMLIPQWSLV
ncbi:MAG: OB-fold domain-containing protein [Gammaproteobacteria bacterium]|nr:OB-fold domain-containing protein [Gammaproteobacteria bacterium]MBT8151391.1 OB-fold domain-containing protein [Gammaproteobacteria bacterium]NND40104.1 DNA-binding protein [Pseudomonadales bacterium]NNM12409.1 DNA-binding protein [Pseudomonadales bacterium]RZV56075.1 MAG: DNA-binding protein [Pseudomonadales bacterium]